MRLLLVLLIPLVDLYLLVLAAGHLGVWPVLAFVVASAVVGGWLARRQGRRVLRGVKKSREAGVAPPEGLLSAGLVRVAGLLMIAPGPMSTLAGIALLVAPVRRGLSRLAHGWFERRVLDPVAASMDPELVARAGGPRSAVIDVETVEPPGDPGRS